MSFISPDFLWFLPVVVCLYYLLPARFRWVLLLCASYFFYMRSTPWTGLLLFGATFISWFCAGQIAKADAAPQESAAISARTAAQMQLGRNRLFWLILGTSAPLSCLFVFKYMGFFFRIGNSLAGILEHTSSVSTWDLLLPVGISFYTFQTLSYVIDVYRDNLPHEPHFGYYALFVSFFPQLVAGPIERPGNLLPQLKKAHPFDMENLRHGLWQILTGFFKKIVVADYLAHFADAVFASPDTANGPGIVLAVCFFAIQIYCDFSGYCDIATGAARMLGIRLMKNFDHPYRADCIRDFWHRWHISLTSWFTDYIYIPLGGNRKGVLRHLCNVLLVFFLSGLWHGAAWHYVIWGCIHGIYLVCGILADRIRHPMLPRPLRRGWTLILVCFAWIFFRAQTLADARMLISHLADGWTIGGIAGSLQLMGFSVLDGIQTALVLLVLALLDPFIEQTKDQRAFAVLFYFILTIAVGWLMLLSQNAVSTFLYFQF